jgi:hypothetical protein
MKNDRRRTARLGAGVVAVIVTGVALGACRSSPQVNYARVYPAALEKGPSLDIQVVRGETTLSMTNTTARVFGPCTLWVNAYYSKPLDGLAVGQTVKMGLSELRNEHGEAFRGGGFFATHKPERMVLAQLEHDGTLYGLVVVRGEPVIK